jgi:SAM-dependent methyltransferase
MVNEPAVYTHGHHESVLRAHRWRTAANSAGYLLGSLKPHMQILDVGCGPGTITLDLAELVPEGQVTGIDADAGVLEQAEAAAEERGVGNVRFETADLYALPYEDASFCVVHAHQVLQHVGDQVGALREMRRVCKPGGLVAARDADYGGMFWYPEIPGMDEWQDLYRRVARGNGGEPDAGRRVHAWARQAGFTDVAVTNSTWCYSTPEERTWWGGLWAERTVASSYARKAVDGGYATEADLRRIADAWREWAASEDGWISIPHGEILYRAD